MAAPALAVLPVRRGRPSRADVLQMELDSRRVEERRHAREMAPLVRRLELVAHAVGPEAWQTVAAVSRLAQRHARRWEPEPEAAA